MQINNALTTLLLSSCLLAAPLAGAQDVEWDISAGNVGIGTGSPRAMLHVQVNDSAYGTPFIVENTSGINFSGFRLQISPNSFIDFNNSGGNFRINTDQKPGAEFEVRPNGNATLSGALTQNSDVNAKRDIARVDQQDILLKLASLPISEWSYKDSPGARHLGPMAQDFYRLFALGNTDRGISSIDTGGVALAAIQALQAQLRDRGGQLQQVRAENTALKNQLVQHDERMVQLEMAVLELLRERGGREEISSLDPGAKKGGL